MSVTSSTSLSAVPVPPLVSACFSYVCGRPDPSEAMGLQSGALRWTYRRLRRWTR
jgi:hypothetical protein